tara:strand:- start:623 stop:844 length:222 start_codon:yes stop_codon:yes gene_type:complete
MITKIEDLQWERLVAIKAICKIAKVLDNLEWDKWAAMPDMHSLSHEIMDIILESGFVHFNELGNLEYDIDTEA